jgi:glutamyl-tRNA synthetase
LHVGSARTALFNWLLARQSGGAFILRVEDTDTARNVEGAEEKIMEDLRWLGLQWDEGIEVGGPHAPYFQSQRMSYYDEAIRRLLAEGRAYHAFDTAEELEALREKAQAEKRTFVYPRPDRFPDEQAVEQARADGRPVVVRFCTGGEDITVHDEVMGNVTIVASELDDFIIRKDNGMPTYHLANVVDDAAMGVNLVLRGQEFLSQTPRHIALQKALGYPTPRYVHMPLTMDMKGRKLSKRDGAVEVFSFRQAGYLPEALVNFIALLGWSPGGDRERFTVEELLAMFSIDRMGRQNSKFDRDKLLAFNTEWAGLVSADRLFETFSDWLNLNPETKLGSAHLDDEMKRTLLAINKGFRTFADIETKSGFIFAEDNEIEYDPAAVKKVLQKGEGAGYDMLEMLVPLLEAAEPWNHQSLEAVVAGVCDAEGVGMGKVAQPIRVAVAGTTVSPAIFDTLVLLGKDKTLNRMRLCLAARS